MKIIQINKHIKCDSILCLKTATYQLITDSYKGNQYLCEDCFKKYQKLFKEIKKSNETK